MLECGIINHDYEYMIGRTYIHAVTNTAGKKNKRQKLTYYGKKAAKRIEKNTQYGSWERYQRMSRIWYDEFLSKGGQPK